MEASVKSGMVRGVEGVLIDIQADISEGLPVFYMIGYLSGAVREAKDRVRTALRNCGCYIPAKRIAVNLAPGDLHKSGTTFDLGIAVALCVALGKIPEEAVHDTIFLGELALDGTLTPVAGVLPIVSSCVGQGIRRCIVPEENGKEAALVRGIDVYGFHHLTEVFSFLNGEITRKAASFPDFSGDRDKSGNVPTDPGAPEMPDLSTLRGQRDARRAMEIAAAGFHHVLLEGPPGVGKSLIASCMPGILPLMSEREMIETTMVYSVKGLLGKDRYLIRQRPFRDPAATVTRAGMFGGGHVPKPGEISLAHHGVLFLDELPEYPRDLIEMFRTPLERSAITLIRNGQSLVFPADFLLIATANPCPCGYYPDPDRCTCSASEIKNYRRRLSGPILDRMDLFVYCTPVTYEIMTDETPAESSRQVRNRVEEARSRQKERFKGSPVSFNGRMSTDQIKRFCPLTEECDKLLESAFEAFGLTGRSYHRLLRVSRTIADLDDCEAVATCHLEEALHFRKSPADAV